MALLTLKGSGIESAEQFLLVAGGLRIVGDASVLCGRRFGGSISLWPSVFSVPSMSDREYADIERAWIAESIHPHQF